MSAVYVASVEREREKKIIFTWRLNYAAWTIIGFETRCWLDDGY